ncbi:hypothetical protein N9W89_06605 [Hellea sp.]|nr:hypothetical protein [Hellea sp.]
MKHLIISACAALALTACASGPSAYGPSDGNSTGFQNQKIQNDRFRVSYTGRTEAEARDFALLRAAEITLAEGYTHFKVVGGNISGNGGPAPISSSIGVGGGNFGRRGGSYSNVNVGLGVGDVARAVEGSKVRESIEIILQSSGSQDPNVYDAKDITDNIRPAVFKN